jgi:hypothetical protein
MNKTFGDQLVELWEEHEQRGEANPEWKTYEPSFRARLLGYPAGSLVPGTSGAVREMFGDAADLLEWEIKPGFGGQFHARAEIPGYTTTLEWTPDVTGLYQFFAWSHGSGGASVRHHIDGRLKLGAVLVKYAPDDDEEFVH